MNEIGDHYAELNKPDPEKQESHVFSHMCNIEKNKRDGKEEERNQGRG
jgi:hypothetical protein